MVEDIDFRSEVVALECRCQFLDKRGFLICWHIKGCAVARIERLVLRAHGIDGDALTRHGIDELDEIPGIRVAVGGIEMTIGPRIVCRQVCEALHFHPFGTRPRHGNNFERRVDSEYLFQYGDDIIRFIRLQSEVVQSLCVAQRVLGAGEVVAADGDAGIAHAVTLGHGIGLFQQFVAVSGSHLEQIETRSIGDGITEAVYLLFRITGVNHDATGIGTGGHGDGILDHRLGHITGGGVSGGVLRRRTRHYKQRHDE